MKQAAKFWIAGGMLALTLSAPVHADAGMAIFGMAAMMGAMMGGMGMMHGMGDNMKHGDQRGKDGGHQGEHPGDGPQAMPQESGRTETALQSGSRLDEVQADHGATGESGH